MGADGAHRSVHKLMGGSFEGEEFDVSFSVTDAEITGDTPQNVVSYCYTPQGSLAFGPLGGWICRVAVSVPHSTDDTPPSREFFQRIVDERGPGHNVLGELRFSTTFRVHARIAAAFRTGRTLLTGDAAHIRSPAGAEGLNTGLQDAVNLGWCLGGVVRVSCPSRSSTATTSNAVTHLTPWPARRRCRRTGAPAQAAPDRGARRRPARGLVVRAGAAGPGAAGGPDRRALPRAQRPARRPARQTRVAGRTAAGGGRTGPRRRAWPAGRGRRSPRTASPCCCGRAPAWRALARRVGDQVRQAFVVEPRYGEGPLVGALGPKPVVAVVRPDGHLHALLAPSQVDELDAVLAAVR